MKLPLFQNDDALRKRPSIPTHGCYFRSLSALAEMHAGETLTPRQIIEQYDWCIDNSHIVDEFGRQAFVMHPNHVGRAAQFHLGVPQTFKAVSRVSIAPYDKHDFMTHDTPTHYIAMGIIAGASIPHFWVIDKDRTELWDPLSPSREKITILSVRGFIL